MKIAQRHALDVAPRHLLWALKPAILIAALIAGSYAVSLRAQSSSLISCPHDDALPLTCTYALNTTGSVDMEESGVGRGVPEQAGTCGSGTGWSRTHLDSGGFNDHPFYLQTFCDWDTVNCATCYDNSWQTGWRFELPSNYAWPRTTTGIFLRTRLFFDRELTDNDHIKWMVWNVGSGSGNRVMLIFDRGNNCPADTGTTSQIAVLLTRNNFYGGGDIAGVCLVLNPGQWYSLQFQWRHGEPGQAFVKGWITSTDESNPDRMDTTIYAVGAPSTWESSDANYNGGFTWGNRANEGLRNTEAFPVRVGELVIDDAFDPTWIAGGGGGPARPGPVRGLRIVSLHDPFSWLTSLVHGGARPSL